MQHIDLCSGIGGFALGFEWAGLSKPVMFCDIEPFSRQILAKHWPDVPIRNDVKELANDPDGLIPDTDPRRTILTAGYPCQPFSFAGKRGGSEDDRHIWPYILSIIQARRPAFCVFENVYGHLSLGLDEVLLDLEREAYTTRPFIVPACAIDARHRRDRLWIISRNVADTNGIRLQRHSEKQVHGQRNLSQQSDRSRQGKPTQRSSQSRLGRMVNGLPKWMDEPPDIPRTTSSTKGRAARLKSLGNAIVPGIAQRIGETIKQCEAA